MPKIPNGKAGTVVEEYMIGNTKIKICNDAYINRSLEEIEQILKRINAKCLNFVRSDKYKPKSVQQLTSNEIQVPAQGKGEQEAHLQEM